MKGSPVSDLQFGQSFPFLVGLIDSPTPQGKEADGLFCGGTLISKQWVLTAAHCFRGRDAKDVNVYVGAAKLNGASGDRIPVDEIRVHPLFRPEIPNSEGDIALVHLERGPEASFGVVKLIAQAEEGKISKTGDTAYVAGWGAVGAAATTTSPVLRVARLQVVDSHTCNRRMVDARLQDFDLAVRSLASELRLPNSFVTSPAVESFRTEIERRASIVTDTMICAAESADQPRKIDLGAVDHSADACQGDSGGPLLVKLSDVLQQIGIVSFSRQACGTPGIPGVYTRTVPYLDWITQETQK